MSDPIQNDNSAPASILGIDINATELLSRRETNTDFTEVKEALVDGLLKLTEMKCTGEGAEGEVIFGTRPSSKLVSGFLLPRFDASGNEDETSDIHISTMGIDLQIASGAGGEIVIRPRAAIYIRQLPTWEEISSPENEMMPQVQLSREVRRNVEELARGFINERLAQLPTLADEDDPDAEGNTVVTAERALDSAENAVEAEEENSVDIETRGSTEAALQAAERGVSAIDSQRERSRTRNAARQARIAAVSEIRKEAFERAFAELGIRLIAQDGSARPVAAGDLTENTVGLTEEDTPAPENTAQSGEEPPPATGAVSGISADGARLEDRHAEPQSIPQKWARFNLDLGEYRYNPSVETAALEISQQFSTHFHQHILATLTAWLNTEEGQRLAYRRNERVLPSHFSSRDNWNRFLTELRLRRPAVREDVQPDLQGVGLLLELDPDFVDPTRRNLRIAIENGASQPTVREISSFEHSLFQVSLEITVPTSLHRALKLDRVESSYRFRTWLDYPAMGLNCGVRQLSSQAIDQLTLQTTWSPRYTQPRLDPREIAGVPTSYQALAQPDSDVRLLLALPDAYNVWIDTLSSTDVGAGLPAEDADRERATFQNDLRAYRRESDYIRTGIELLCQSQQAASELAVTKDAARKKILERRAIPWLAWLRTNETFQQYGGTRFTDWRLFQLTFILSHIPTLASRMEEFSDQFNAFRDEDSASLLYFPTGGGKSEAFFGLLIFNLFFDRLRGKSRGVTSLVRYPLRLLTLQQARRLLKIVVRAELVRRRSNISGWPFEIGFWVGSGNTPNRVAQGFGGVPTINMEAYRNDTTLLTPPTDSSKRAVQARRRSARYREALESYDKLRNCPCCGAETGMRKYPSQFGRIGIVCFDDACEWNREHRHSAERTPLPFILTDDTIYQRAPSIVLGTVDKSALIGQHDRTINAIVGMFGMARYIHSESGHLFVPRGSRALAKAEEDGLQRLQPAFNAGRVIFHDPFPSLVIQDEGHLLDESLGTFSGLFETTLEQLQLRLGSNLLSGAIAKWPSGQATGRPRLAKVIAATATISDPDRQLRVLYQREPLRFPCPGPNIYESFYAAPRVSRVESRSTYANTLNDRIKAEKSSPWMRVYTSMMTNGRSHTVTTACVVSAYHLVYTRLWRDIVENGNAPAAITRLVAVLDQQDPLSILRNQRLTELANTPQGISALASLLDLQRISLTYVTNKKGGDQIIETLQTQVERDQKGDEIFDLPFNTELISGGVTVAEIQDVMRRAEDARSIGQVFPPLGESLRNIVATSAISHGVDVDKFNAMFFAGLPSDIAEYIQASSRVGRSHTGFSMLIPTPHSRRDRYVVETHDQFHRFLERMIPPPAVQRWAERAIRRVIPSIFQTYLCGVLEQEIFVSQPDNDKGSATTITTAAAVKGWADRCSGGSASAVRQIVEFASAAIGTLGRGERNTGAATDAPYYNTLLERGVLELMNIFVARSDPSKLSNFWSTIESRTIRKPMTSLRDVDAGGVIVGATRDPYRRKNVHLETVRQVMKIIRGQRSTSQSDVDADPSPVDQED